MDDLMKAFGAFNQGLQSLAINTGINNATQKVDEINNSLMSALEKRQAQSQLADQLALQLTGMGANASQVQQAFTSIAPPQIKDSQDAYQQALVSGDKDLLGMAKNMQSFERANQEELQNDQQKFQASESSLNRQLQRDLAGMRNKPGSGLRAEAKTLREFQKEYTKDVRDFQKVSRQFTNARDLILKNSPMAAAALRPLLARASGEVGNLSETEQKAWEGRQDLKTKMERWVKTGATSTMTAADKKAILGIVSIYEKNANNILNDYASHHARQAASLLDADEEEVGSVITGGRYKKSQPMKETQSSGGATGSFDDAPVKKNFNKYFE